MNPSHDELIQLAGRYLEALSANDPGRLPSSPHLKFTENGQTLAVGKGLWATAQGHGRYTLAFAQADAGQVGCFVTVDEMGHRAILSARLRVQDGLLTELETLVVRPGCPLWNPDGLVEPRATFLETVPPEERSTSEELVRISNLYFDGIEQSNGSIIPVTEDCIRIENGVQTTRNPARGTAISGMGVAEAISTGFYDYITEIRDRRYPIVDVERGLCFGIVFFEHPGFVRSVQVPGVGTVELAPFTQRPSSAMIGELFKVRGGRIEAIEAVLEFMPFGMKSGWN